MIFDRLSVSCDYGKTSTLTVRLPVQLAVELRRKKGGHCWSHSEMGDGLRNLQYAAYSSDISFDNSRKTFTDSLFLYIDILPPRYPYLTYLR